MEDKQKKVTTVRLAEMKQNGEKISMLTAYDYTTAKIFDAAGVDSILVGDSASNVMQGNDTTLPITVDEMICYARSVARACKRAFVVCDMPFGSYQMGREQGMQNAMRIFKEAGVDAVKLEGGQEIASTIRGITAAGMPVVGHLGLTPQSVKAFGGYGLRAAAEAEEGKLYADVTALCQAGCCAIVLEKVPKEVAKEARKHARSTVPLIGIGAGNEADGQVLVWQDMMGMNDGFRPKFVRRFANIGQAMAQAVREYDQAVKDGSFPNEDECYHRPQDNS